jgi:hypothetical protein
MKIRRESKTAGKTGEVQSGAVELCLSEKAGIKDEPFPGA